MLVSRNRQWTHTPDFEPREWESTKHFDESWLDAVIRAQSNIIPVEEVEKAKSWFEYLPNLVTLLIKVQVLVMQ